MEYQFYIAQRLWAIRVLLLTSDVLSALNQQRQWTRFNSSWSVGVLVLNTMHAEPVAQGWYQAALNSVSSAFCCLFGHLHQAFLPWDIYESYSCFPVKRWNTAQTPRGSRTFADSATVAKHFGATVPLNFAVTKEALYRARSRALACTMRFLDAHCSPKEPYSDVDDLAYHRRFVGIRVAVCACRGASCLRAYVRDILNKCVDSCGRYVVVFALGDTLADKNKLSLKSHSTWFAAHNW